MTETSLANLHLCTGTTGKMPACFKELFIDPGTSVYIFYYESEIII